MKILDLFAGLQGWSELLAARGHDVVTLDLDPRFGCTFSRDILEVESLAELGGPFDLVLASPPCEAFSVLRIGTNWTGPGDSPPHAPKTDAARLAARIVTHTRSLIEDADPAFFVIENPVAKLRKLAPVAGLERRTVTYCRFGEPFRKPTDLWGGFPPSLVLPPPCAVTRKTAERDGFTWALGLDGEPCHVSAPRGSTTGIQGTGVTKGHRQMAGTSKQSDLAAIRAKIPAGLALAVILAAEADLAAGLTWRSAGQLNLLGG